MSTQVAAPNSGTEPGVESFTIPWPSTQNGDILFLNVGTSNTIETPTGWTEIASGDINGFLDKAIFAIVADGTETGNITVSRSGTGATDWCWILDHWRDVAGYKISTEATGNSANPDSPSLTTTPDFAEGDVFISTMFLSNDNRTISSYPTNYTGDTSAILNATAATSYRAITAETEDPGQYTISAGQNWSAYTIALEPAGVTETTLTAEQGTYTLTGQDAGLLNNFVITAEQGTYTTSGSNTTLLENKVLQAAQGSYTFTGQDAALTKGFILTAEQGTYTLTGQDATLLFNRVLAAQQGTYTLTGQDTNLLRNLLLEGGAGNYVLSGQNVTFTTVSTGATLSDGRTYTIKKLTLDQKRVFYVISEDRSYSIESENRTLTVEP